MKLADSPLLGLFLSFLPLASHTTGSPIAWRELWDEMG